MASGLTCSLCSAEIPDGATVCPVCQFPVDAAPVAAAEVKEPVVASAPVIQEELQIVTKGSTPASDDSDVEIVTPNTMRSGPRRAAKKFPLQKVLAFVLIGLVVLLGIVYAYLAMTGNTSDTGAVSGPPVKPPTSHTTTPKVTTPSFTKPKPPTKPRGTINDSGVGNSGDRDGG